jgi:hypothetical protein
MVRSDGDAMKISPTAPATAGAAVPSAVPSAGRSRWLFTIPALALLTLSACGGTTSTTDASSDDALANEVASLDDSEALPDAQDAGSTLDADEAALEFSACLREQGLDVPDIGVDADGNVQVRDALDAVDRTDGSFRDAMDACADILADTGFGGGGGGPGGGLRDSVEMQDALVELTDCMRDQGFDEATELTLGQPGGGQAADGEAAGEPSADRQRGQGEGQGPGQGDRTARFITQMGLDPEDPAVVEAMDVCVPIIDDAFTAAGIGQAGDN